MMVNMPVEAIDDQCLGCPELDIVVDTTMLYVDAEGRPIYANVIKCSHLGRCQVLLETREEHSSK